MIQIREMPDGNSMIISSVSDFCDSMGFCEFKIRHFLKGVRPPQTKVTIEGTKSHEKEAEYEREHFKFIPLTQDELEDINEDIEFAREGIFTRLLTKTNYGKKNLLMLIVGQADKIARSKGMLIVEETKYPENTGKYLGKFEPYEDQKMQALLYLNSHFTENGSLNPENWFEIPHKEKAWIINIKDKKTSESVRIFKGIQTEDAEEFLKGKIDKFALVVMGNLQPEHHKNVKKCRSCRFFSDCEYKITNSQN
jgi:hypothetical protein